MHILDISVDIWSQKQHHYEILLFLEIPLAQKIFDLKKHLYLKESQQSLFLLITFPKPRQLLLNMELHVLNVTDQWDFRKRTAIGLDYTKRKKHF